LTQYGIFGTYSLFCGNEFYLAKSQAIGKQGL